MFRGKGRGVGALLLGATGIGWAPIFVRLSEVGPIATGFYRIALAQPILWWILQRQSSVESSAENPASVSSVSKARVLWFAALAGLCFAGDLALWHWSIRLTTVANSTLLTNLAPFFVTLGGYFFFREQVTRRLLIGMFVAFLGSFLLVVESLNLEHRFLVGDFLAIVTAVFYSGYLLAVKKVRATRTVWYVMAWSGVFTAPILLILALLSRENLWPRSAGGWLILLALAIVSHIGGQGLIAYGLAHVSASASSVLLMWQPVVAAVLAWWILGEPLTLVRAVGGAVIIAGILSATRRPAEVPQRADQDGPQGAAA